MRRKMIAVAAMCVATASLPSWAAVVDLNGADMTVTDVNTIADGVTNSSSTPATLTIDISADATLSADLSGSLKLVKSGTGTLTLSAAARTYTGGTLVNAGGKLKLANNSKVIGTGALTVVDGAAVDFNGAIVSSPASFPSIYAAGTGPDGNGALLNTGTAFGNNGFSQLYLTGDLLIKTGNRMNFINVHTQGSTLRYQGGEQVAFSTVDNSQGGDVSIESGQYTAWGTVNTLGNTPSKGKVYMRGGRLGFYATLSVANDIIVEKSSRLSQGKAGSTATFTGKLELNDTLIVDKANPIVFKGKVCSPANVKKLQISDNGSLSVTFNGCAVSNINCDAWCGTTTLASGTTWYSPNGAIRHLMGNTQADNHTSSFNIAAGSDTTVSYFSSGNSDFSTVTTGIVNQVGGTFNTVGRYNTAESDGLRLGHYVNARSIWNMSGGSLVVGDPYRLNLSIVGQGTFNLSAGEVSVTEINICARSSSTTGVGNWNMTGGLLNLGTNGIQKASSRATYAITLGGGIVRASHADGFSSALNMTLTGSSGTNVTFDTQSANVTLSGVLSGVGGLRKAGTGTLTLSGANTYTGATTVEAGYVAFTNAYPGGDLEISASALSNAASAIVAAASFAFAEGKGVRILNADTLDYGTFGATKVIVSSTAQIASLPSLTLVASDGTTLANTGKWNYRLSADGRTLKFGPSRGLMILVR